MPYQPIYRDSSINMSTKKCTDFLRQVHLSKATITCSFTISNDFSVNQLSYVSMFFRLRFNSQKHLDIFSWKIWNDYSSKNSIKSNNMKSKFVPLTENIARYSLYYNYGGGYADDIMQSEDYDLLMMYWCEKNYWAALVKERGFYGICSNIR